MYLLDKLVDGLLYFVFFMQNFFKLEYCVANPFLPFYQEENDDYNYNYFLLLIGKENKEMYQFVFLFIF